MPLTTHPLRSCVLLPILLVFVVAVAFSASKINFPKNYKGTPYQDARYQGGTQKIPGRVNAPTMIAVEKVLPTTTPTQKTTAAGPSIRQMERT